jgi:hypothetical protein
MQLVSSLLHHLRWARHALNCGGDFLSRDQRLTLIRMPRYMDSSGHGTKKLMEYLRAVSRLFFLVCQIQQSPKYSNQR